MTEDMEELEPINECILFECDRGGDIVEDIESIVIINIHPYSHFYIWNLKMYVNPQLNEKLRVIG
jgi:hypothetical protein